MNSSNIWSAQTLGQADPSWSIIGAADFNGDGRSDLLWRQSGSGMLAEWLMDGSQITSSQIIGATPNSARQVQSRPTNSAV